MGLRNTSISLMLACAGAIAFNAIGYAASGAAFADFNATALTGETVTQEQLLGETTLLIVTPSKNAAEDTRAWVSALRSDIETKELRIRDVLAIDLPFFMSEEDALGRARERIPASYHDQTWLLSRPVLEKSLSIPISSEDAFVFVFNAEGKTAARVQGTPTEKRIQQLKDALAGLR